MKAIVVSLCLPCIIEVIIFILFALCVLSSTRQHVGEALLALKRVHHEIYTTPCGATVYSFSHNMYHNSNTSVFVIATVAQQSPIKHSFVSFAEGLAIVVRVRQTFTSVMLLKEWPSLSLASSVPSVFLFFMTYGSIDGSLISLTVRLGNTFVRLYFYLACNRSLEIYMEEKGVLS